MWAKISLLTLYLVSILVIYYNLGNIDKGPLQVQGNVVGITCGVGKITPLEQGLVEWIVI
jgi:hypothetical protein